MLVESQSSRITKRLIGVAPDVYDNSGFQPVVNNWPQPASQSPVYDIIDPPAFVGSRYFDIIIGISFHHPAFIVAFKQHFAGLPLVLLREVLHFHI